MHIEYFEERFEKNGNEGLTELKSNKQKVISSDVPPALVLPS